MASNDPAAYGALGRSSRRHMQAWAGRQAVTQRLDAALDAVIGLTRGVVRPATEPMEASRSVDRRAA